jgi:hypothetical protein
VISDRFFQPPDKSKFSLTVAEYHKHKDVERAHLTVGHLVIKLGEAWTTALKSRELFYCIAETKNYLGAAPISLTFLGPVSSQDKNLQKAFINKDPTGSLPTEVIC